MNINGISTPDEFWSDLQRGYEQMRRSFEDLPLYAPVFWPGQVMIGEWIFEGGPRGLMHGLPEGNEPFLHVRTTEGDPWESVFLLWMMHRYGLVHDKAAYSRYLSEFEAQTPVQRTLPVADTLLDFNFWEDDGKWWAAGSRPGQGISLEARNMSPGGLQLDVVTDIEPYITGRNEWIREQRGES